MIHLILDYYRRWGLVLVLGAALQLIQGWSITVDPQTPVEFTASMIPIFMGLVLPSYILSRGVIRVVGTLPLTLGKIGRGWWLANVLIPAVILVALLFLGAGAAAFCHRDKAFHLNRLGMSSLLTVLWQGTMFDLVLPAIFPRTGKFTHRWRGILVAFVGAILKIIFIFWMVFGLVLSPGAVNNPVKLAIFLVGGTCLTFVGWFRAWRFDQARVQSGPPNTALAAKFDAHPASVASFARPPLSTAPHQPPAGPGGIPFLLRLTFIHGLGVYFFGAILILFWAWVAPRFPAWMRPVNGWDGFKTNNPAVLVLLTFILLQRLPFVTLLRFLRTLPVSTPKLAAVIIASEILPPIAVGMLMVGIAGLSAGTPAVWMVLNRCLLILAPIALSISITVWRGGGRLAYAFSIAAMLAWVWAISTWQNVTFPLAGGIAVAGVTLAWPLTGYALLHGRRPSQTGRFVPLT